MPVNAPVPVPTPVNAPVPTPLNVPVPVPVNVPVPVPVNVPVPTPLNVPVPAPVNVPVPAPLPVNVPVPAPVIVTFPAPIPAPLPLNAPIPVPVNAPVPVAVNAPVPVSASVDAPVDPPIAGSAPVPVPIDSPIPVPVNQPISVPVNVSVPVPVDQPVPVAAPISLQVDSPIPSPVDVSVPVPVDQPVPVAVPISLPVDSPIPAPVEPPVAIPVNQPISAPIPVPIPSLTNAPASLPTTLVPSAGFNVDDAPTVSPAALIQGPSSPVSNVFTPSLAEPPSSEPDQLSSEVEVPVVVNGDFLSVRLRPSGDLSNLTKLTTETVFVELVLTPAEELTPAEIQSVFNVLKEEFEGYLKGEADTRRHLTERKLARRRDARDLKTDFVFVRQGMTFDANGTASSMLVYNQTLSFSEKVTPVDLLSSGSQSGSEAAEDNDPRPNFDSLTAAEIAVMPFVDSSTNVKMTQRLKDEMEALKQLDHPLPVPKVSNAEDEDSELLSADAFDQSGNEISEGAIAGIFLSCALIFAVVGSYWVHRLNEAVTDRKGGSTSRNSR